MSANSPFPPPGGWVRRLSAACQHLGHYEVALDTLITECIGRQRTSRWRRWIWADYVGPDDTRVIISRATTSLPQRLFDLSDRIAAAGRGLERSIYDGESHTWFLVTYWFIIAVQAPIAACTRAVILFQLCVWRLFRRTQRRPPGISFASAGAFCLLLAGAYLVPFISHPSHNLGVPFLVATLIYATGGIACLGIVRVNQHILFRACHQITIAPVSVRNEP